MRYRTYTLRIEAVDGASLEPDEMGDLTEAVNDAEEMISNALPEGFYCKIDWSGEGVDLAAVRQLEQMGPGLPDMTEAYRAIAEDRDK